MKHAMRRILALVLAVLLLTAGTAWAEDLEVEESIETAAGETITEKDGWHFDARGFLTGEDNPGDEYLLEDEENGVWQYASRDLSIRITRFREDYKKGSKKIREYCVADIWASPASPMMSIATVGDGKKPLGYKQVSPALLVEKNPCVFAMSDDFSGQRLKNIMEKKSSRQPGIIIRNGEIRWNKTKARDSKTARQRPCLDTLAVYNDGSMKTYLSDEMTGEEYLEKGAWQVFAFGPWLISEGKINEKEAVEGCGYYEQMEPLCGLGMVEPWHYIAVVLKGRPKTKYAGAHLSWLADKMLEYGCTEALNLDGGGTAVMMFNGKVVIQGQESLRSMGSMITFGMK